MFGFFYAKAGLRYEHTNDDGITLEGLSVSNKYDHWFPFAEISYNPSDNHSFALSYSKRIDRPSMNDMNPTRVFVTPTHTPKVTIDLHHRSWTIWSLTMCLKEISLLTCIIITHLMPYRI